MSRFILFAALLAGCTEIVAVEGIDDTHDVANPGLAKVGETARVVNTGGAGLRLRSGAGGQRIRIAVPPPELGGRRARPDREPW